MCYVEGFLWDTEREKILSHALPGSFVCVVLFDSHDNLRR